MADQTMQQQAGSQNVAALIEAAAVLRRQADEVAPVLHRHITAMNAAGTAFTRAYADWAGRAVAALRPPTGINQ